MTRRLRALLGVELRTEWRYGVPLAMVGLAAFWSLLLALLPESAARAATPYLLLLDIMTVGTLFAGMLTITDRSTGAAGALGVSPARSWEYVVARIAPLGALTAVSAVPILLAGRRTEGLADKLVACTLCGLLLLGVATGIAARQAGFVSFMLASAAPIALLFTPSLAVSMGLLAGPIWYLAPSTGALALLQDAAPYPTGWLLGYLALCAVVAIGYAAGSLRRGLEAAPGRSVIHLRPLPIRPRWLVFPRADVRNVTRDSILAMVVVSPLLLALALRFGYPPLADWLRQTRGVDLAPYEPALAMLAVAVHVPVSFGMTGAMVVLDDVEDRALAAVRTSPLGVSRYLAYRLLTVTLLGAAGLAVAAPLSGLVPSTAAGALGLSALLGPLTTLAILAVARSRVQGVTAAKILALPAYLPIAAWLLIGPASWLLAPLPASWIARAWTGGGALPPVAGLICLAAWLIPLARRVTRRLATE